MPLRKRLSAARVARGVIYDLPRPLNLSIWWNWGSILGICLVVQLVTGVFIAMHYCADADIAFVSVVHIWRDVKIGWFVRRLHANIASGFMFALFVHIGRGLYYGSYLRWKVWMVGVVMFVLVIGVAFLGYVLPWGQISFWGATVITNMITVVPYAGQDLSWWLWGGYTVGDPTLKRFFVLHFLLPFVIALFSVIHLVHLHEGGSSNPLGVKEDFIGVRFHSYYSFKDLVGLLVFLGGLLFIVFFFPHVFGDPVNFVPANSMKTPEHIKPEWYFLFVYAILRSIPTKGGGVVAILIAILILAMAPLFYKGHSQRLIWYISSRYLFWGFVVVFVLLMWVGGSPAEEPYVTLGRALTVLYFALFFLIPASIWVEDELMQEWYHAG